MATNGTQVSWIAVGASVTIVGLLWGAQWQESQTEFANVAKIEEADRAATIRSFELQRQRVIALENEQAAIRERTAHDPVESRTFDATIQAIEKQIDQIQIQIQDVNRQIAAALIIIDNNSAAPKRSSVPMPP